MKKLRGFTLIEAIMVISVIGILAALAIPRFATVGKKSAYMISRQIVVDMRYARSLAVTTGTTHIVKFFPAGASKYSSYGIFKDADPDVQIGNLRQIPETVTCTSSTEQFNFEKLGNATGGTITLEDNARHYAVYVIASTGRVFEQGL
ncbi:MAG: GspH/FimT family pseudopilin [bacterium]